MDRVDEDKDYRNFRLGKHARQDLAMRMGEQDIVRQFFDIANVELAAHQTVEQIASKVCVTPIAKALGTRGLVRTVEGKFTADVNSDLRQILFAKVFVLVVADKNKRIGFLRRELFLENAQAMADLRIPLLARLRRLLGNFGLQQRIV